MQGSPTCSCSELYRQTELRAVQSCCDAHAVKALLAFSHSRLEQTRSRELLRSRTCTPHKGLLLAVLFLDSDHFPGPSPHLGSCATASCLGQALADGVRHGQMA